MSANPGARTPFAAYIESITEVTGWSPTELARKANVATSTLTRPRSDARHRFKPSLTTLQKLAKVAPNVPPPPELTRAMSDPGIKANDPPDAGAVRLPASLHVEDDRHAGMTVPSHLRVAADGRVELSTSLVARLDAQPGEVLITRVVDGVLTIETVDNALRRVRASVSRHVPEGVSLVDELMAERRAEAARD